MRDKRFVWLSIVVLLAGFIIRLGLHDYYGLEGDDGVSLAVSRYETGEMISGLMALRLDIHPPLHFLVLKIWTGLTGESLLALRLMNILLDLLTGALLLRLTGRSFGRYAALAAGVLWLAAPLLIFGTYLVRMYTLMTFCGTAGLFCLVEYQHVSASRRWLWMLGAAACGLAAAYTHIVGFVILGGLALAALVIWLVSRKNGRDFIVIAGVFGLAGLLYLPFALPVWDLYSSGRSLGASYNPGNFATLLDVPATITTVLLAHNGLQNALVSFGLLLILLLASLLLVRRFGKRAASLLVLVWISIAVMSALAWFAGLYKPRYLTPFAPLLLALLAGILTLIPRRTWRNVVLLMLVGLSGWSVLHDLDYQSRDDWTAAAAFVTAHEQPGDVVVVIPDWGAEPFRCHYRGAANVTGILSAVAEDIDLDAALRPLVEGHSRVWLLRYQVEISDPLNRADNWFRAQAATITEVFPSSVQVKYYDFAPVADSLPGHVRPLDAQFGDVAALRGVWMPVNQGLATDTRLHPPSNWAQVTLYWEALQPGTDFIPRVRLTDGFGQMYGGALERDNDLLRRMPVTTWESGRLYSVTYDLNLNPQTPPGTYNIEVMALNPADSSPITSSGADAGEYWVIAGQFTVEG